MTATFTIGTWFVPLLITLFTYFTAFAMTRDVRGGGYMDLSGLSYLFAYGAATIVNLVVWLVWALLTRS